MWQRAEIILNFVFGGRGCRVCFLLFDYVLNVSLCLKIILMV